MNIKINETADTVILTHLNKSGRWKEEVKTLTERGHLSNSATLQLSKFLRPS